MKKPTPKRTSRNSSSAKKPAKLGPSRRKLPPVETRFKPGQSGNPAGRKPKGQVLSDALRDLMQGETMRVEVSTRSPKGRLSKRTLEINTDSGHNIAYGLAAALINKAITGNVHAFSEIADRVQGKAHQSIGIAPTSGPETPVPDDILAEMADRLRERGEA